MNAKVRVVCATRETAENFPVKTVLGSSLALCRGLFELRLFRSNSRGLPHAYNAAIRAIDVMHASDGAFGTAGWRQGYQRYIAKWQF